MSRPQVVVKMEENVREATRDIAEKLEHLATELRGAASEEPIDRLPMVVAHKLAWGLAYAGTDRPAQWLSAASQVIIADLQSALDEVRSSGLEDYSLDDCPACDAPLARCRRGSACCEDCAHAANWPPPKPSESKDGR